MSEVKAVSIVPLEEFIVVGEELLGFHWRAKLTDSIDVEICFPVIKDKDAFAVTLKSPYDGIKYCDDRLNWGGEFHVSGYHEIIDYKISCLLVKYYSNEEIVGIKINKTANAFLLNFIKVLEVIAPHSLFKETKMNNRGSISNFTVSCFKLGNGDFLESGLICAPDCRGAEKINLEALNYAIENASRSVNLPYQTLYIARRCLHSGDYRGCILNCASSIEIPFHKAIDQYMKEKSIPIELVKCRALKVHGINQAAELCRNLGINLKIEKKEEVVMKKRNDVIHNGYYPSYLEAYDCYYKTLEFLKLQGIELFED